MPNPIRLQIKNLGHIPAIKNSMYAIVDKKNRQWKKLCVESFVSQLLSSIQTNEPGTVTPQSVLSLMQSLPADDSWKNIPEHSVRCIKVAKGEEGAEILIEEIP